MGCTETLPSDTLLCKREIQIHALVVIFQGIKKDISKLDRVIDVKVP